MPNYDEFLGDSSISNRSDAKFNIFRFQDHLLNLINTVAYSFFVRDYPSAFESLQNLFLDTHGFFTKTEFEDLEKLWKKAHTNNNNYITYNINYNNIRSKIKNQTYSPPPNLYDSLVQFRLKLMRCMTEHQLLIPKVKKGYAGAGSQE